MIENEKVRGRKNSHQHELEKMRKAIPFQKSSPSLLSGWTYQFDPDCLGEKTLISNDEVILDFLKTIIRNMKLHIAEIPHQIDFFLFSTSNNLERIDMVMF